MDLTRTLQVHELLWLIFMTLGAAANIFAGIQSLADRAAAKRAVIDAGKAWSGHPSQIVARQQIRNAILPLVLQLAGVGLGVAYALQAPARPDMPLTRGGAALTLFLLVVAAILSVKPILNLWDARRLYAMAGLFDRSPAVRRRGETVGNALGLAGALLALALVVYATALWQDLMVQSRLDGGLPLTPARYLAQLFRAVLSQAVTGLWAAVAMGAIVGAFVRIYGSIKYPGRKGDIG